MPYPQRNCCWAVLLFELHYYTEQEEFDDSSAKPVKLPYFYVKARHAMVIQPFHEECRRISLLILFLLSTHHSVFPMIGVQEVFVEWDKKFVLSHFIALMDRPSRSWKSYFFMTVIISCGLLHIHFTYTYFYSLLVISLGSLSFLTLIRNFYF